MARIHLNRFSEHAMVQHDFYIGDTLGAVTWVVARVLL